MLKCSALYNEMKHNTKQYSNVEYSIVQCNVMKHSIMQESKPVQALQYNMTGYSTVSRVQYILMLGSAVYNSAV